MASDKPEVLFEGEVRDDRGVGLGYRVVSDGNNNAGWQQRWRPAKGDAAGSLWDWFPTTIMPHALYALAAERSRLEGERDEAVEALRYLVSECSSNDWPETNYPFRAARALLARLEAGGEED